MKNILLITGLMFTVAYSTTAQQLTGGTYAVDQSVLAGLGGTASGGSYVLDGTGGEPVAGVRSSGSPYSLDGGFWPSALTPTAAGAEISGTVLGPNGEPLRGLTVMLSGGSFTTPMIVKTNNFGMFSFRGIEAGAVYVVGVVSRRYGFEQQNQVVTLTEDVTSMVFRAGWVN